TYIIPAFILDSEFEDTVRDSIRVTDSGGYLAIDPDIQNSFIIKVKEMLKENNNLTVSPAIVTQMDIRRYVKSMLEKEMNFLPILSFREVGNLAEIHTLGVIEVS
nr:FHIPEP family type III secretion protein [Burkholderiales bacterium]